MKRFVFLFIIIFSFFQNEVKGQFISETTEISIITCAPGADLYSVFGHTAIRIKDPSKRMDNVYNYGTFNFETPNFYFKFVQGKLDYMLDVVPYKYFVNSYINEGRWIKEQTLNLNYEQKLKIYKFLQNNALPENKYYRYDFFYDNCATRVKDVIKDVLGEDMIMPKSVTKDGETFRDMLMPYLAGKNWERFGINIILGQPADKVVDVDEASFLPDFHEMIFDSSKVIIEGKELPLVMHKKMLFDPKSTLNNTTLVTPEILLWIFFGIVVLLTFIEFRYKKYFIGLDKSILFFTGFVGLIILLTWFGTDHKAVVNNWNIIWANPLYFIAAFMLKKQNNLLYLKSFMLLWSIILLIALISNFSFYHLFDFALIPLILVLLIRTSLIHFSRK